MTRVHHRPHARPAASSLQRARVARRKKPYKILLESVTQEKKKLHSAISYDAHAPVGYTFVPAGTPELTEYCKELCRKRGLIAHIVSAKPKNRAHANPDKIAHHVHRIGHHFPNEVVDQACDWLGYVYRGGIYQKTMNNLGTSVFARSLATHGTRLGLHDRPVTIQETSQQIKAAILDLFPKIPDKDAEAIVKHAFREGTKRVGNAQELPLPRRVQLAVVAHIRHEYTDYDQLLKTGSWMDARQKVEEASLDQLRRWRGEDDTGIIEMEETFREVIVLDDDEEEDGDDSSEEQSSTDDRERSIEIFSSQATAHELQPDDLHDAEWTDMHSTNRAPGKVYFVRPTPRRIRAVQSRPTAAYSSPRKIPMPITATRSRDAQAPLTYSQEHTRPIRYPLPPNSTAAHGREMQHEHDNRRLILQTNPRTSFNPSAVEQPLRYCDEHGRLYNLQPINDYSSILPNHSSIHPRPGESVHRHHLPQTAPIPKHTLLHNRRDFPPSPRSISLTNRETQPLRFVHAREHPIPESDVAIPSIERDISEPAELSSIDIVPKAHHDHVSGLINPGAMHRGQALKEHVPNERHQFAKRKSWPSPRRDIPRDVEPGVPKRQAIYDETQYRKDGRLQNSQQADVIDLTSSPRKPLGYASQAPYSFGQPPLLTRRFPSPIDQSQAMHKQRVYTQLARSPSIPRADERFLISDDEHVDYRADGRRTYRRDAKDQYQGRAIRRYGPHDQIVDLSYS